MVARGAKGGGLKHPRLSPQAGQDTWQLDCTTPTLSTVGTCTQLPRTKQLTLSKHNHCARISKFTDLINP